MSAEPFSWNIVVIGAWNPAILTPDGIRRRLFELPDGTPINVEVAVDRPGPFRVIHDGLAVIPTPVSLEVTTTEPNIESLERASGLCVRALQSLPETPVSAAGVNIRYRFQEIPDQVLDLVRAPLDSALSDAGFQFSGSVTKRTLTHNAGVINVQIANNGPEGTIEFNFHRDSTVPSELREWLSGVHSFVTLSDRIATVVGVTNVRKEIHA